MSEVKTDKLSPRTASGTVTLGTSGDTFTIPSGVTLTNNGSSSGFDSGLASVQTFTSSGTWTKPSGVRLAMVEVQGAGGAATKSTTNGNRNGGGGGGYAKKLLDVSSISSATITVGSGGAGSILEVPAFGLTERTPLLAEAVRVEMALPLIAVQLVEPLQVVI